MPDEKCYLDVPFELKAEDIMEDGTFKGYGSLFVKEPDSHRDIVKKGAFSKTLAKGGRNGTGIAMLWQHRPDRIPGVWSVLKEDSKGLYSEGRLALKTTLGNDVYQILKLGAELGTFKLSQSIGYDPIKYNIDEKEGIRTLNEVELWECSICTFPARTGATILTVKSIEDAKTERQLELVLRDSGVSKSVAQYIVKLCKPSLRESDDELVEDNILSGILDELKNVNEDLNDFIINEEILGSLKQINI